MVGWVDRRERELSAARTTQQRDSARNAPARAGTGASSAPRGRNTPTPNPPAGRLARWHWRGLPAGDYEQAVTLWPVFAGSDRVAGPGGPLSHAQYCRTIQKILVEYTEAGVPGLTIAPVRVAPFTEWCAEQGQQPDSAEARAHYAAYLSSQRDPALIAWPPGRNEPCWCGSGYKYKRCCAAKISAATEEHG